MKTDNNVEAQQEVNSGKAEAAQKQHGVNRGHTASEPPYRRTEFTAPAAASAPFARNDSAERPCATCNDDPEECAKVPGLRHCEKTNRSSTREER